MTKFKLVVPLTFEGEFNSEAEAISRARKMRAELDSSTALTMYDVEDVEVQEVE